MQSHSGSAPRRKWVLAAACLIAAALVFQVWKGLNNAQNLADMLSSGPANRILVETEDLDTVALPVAGEVAAPEDLPNEIVGSASDIRVAVTHMFYSEDTAQARQLDDWFYEAFILGLRSVPNVVVIEHAATDITALATIIYQPSTPVDSTQSLAQLVQSSDMPPEVAERLANSLGPRLANAAAVTQQMTDGGVSSYAYRYTAFRLQPDGPEAEPYDYQVAVGATFRDELLNSAQASAVYYVNRQQNSVGAAKQVPAGSLLVRDDMTELAAEIVLSLRRRMLPSELSALGEPELPWLDVTLPVDDRLRAFQLAVEDVAKSNSAELKSSFVSGLLALLTDSAGDNPGFEMYRLAAMRLLERVSDERVVVPLSDMLLYEASDNIRLAAVRILGNHRDDETAHRALESASQSDASPEVRRQASWLAQDDASRVETITWIIRNADLTPAERLAPIYPTLAGQLETATDIDANFTFDPDTVQVLDDLVRRHEPIVARYYTSWYLARNHPESFVPLMIDRLQNDEGPRIRINMIEGLRTQLAVPEARAALEQAARIDPEEMVRIAAASALEGRQTNPAMLGQ